MKFIDAFLQNEEGAILAEYVFLVSLIAALCVLAVTQVGASIKALFDRAVTVWPG